MDRLRPKVLVQPLGRRPWPLLLLLSLPSFAPQLLRPPHEGQGPNNRRLVLGAVLLPLLVPLAAPWLLKVFPHVAPRKEAVVPRATGVVLLLLPLLLLRVLLGAAAAYPLKRPEQPETPPKVGVLWQV